MFYIHTGSVLIPPVLSEQKWFSHHRLVSNLTKAASHPFPHPTQPVRRTTVRRPTPHDFGGRLTLLGTRL